MDLCVKVEGMRVCFELKCAGLWQAAIHHKQFLCSAVPLEQKKKRKGKSFASRLCSLRKSRQLYPSFLLYFSDFLGTQTLGPNLYATLSYIQIFSLHPLSRGKYDNFLHKIEFVLQDFFIHGARNEPRNVRYVTFQK